MPSPVIGRGTNGGIRFRRSFDRGWTYYSITDAESTAFFKIFHTLFFDDLACRRCARTRRAGAMRKLTDASPYGRCARGRAESRSLPLQTMRAWARLCSKSAAAPSLAVIRTFFAGSCGPARLLRTSHAMARRRGTGRDALRERFSMGGATAAFRPNFAPRRRRDAGAHSGMPVLPSGRQRWDEQTPWREERNRDASASGAQTRRDLPGAFVARRTTPTRPPGRGGALSRESAVPGKGEDAQFGRAGTPEACLRRAPCSRTLRRQRPRNCSRMQRRLADAFKMRRIAAARARKGS